MNASDTSLRLRGAATGGRHTARARGVLALVGLFALLALLSPEPRHAMLQFALALAPSSQDGADESSDADTAAARATAVAESAALGTEQLAVAQFIARRYRVGDRAASGFVDTAYRVGHELRVDPLLILAVAAVESSYNPLAESFLGAKGLMQVIPKYHPEKLREHGGEEALLDPQVNILVGAKILREYLRRFGVMETALQVYGGAHDEPTLQYANKVLAERARLQQTARRAGS